MQPVQDLASREERQAAAHLGECLGQVRAARQQLDELIGWERDYAARMRQGAVSLSELQSYRLFMCQLGEAIGQQRAALAEAERGMTRAREQWEARYARHAALSQVIERCRADQRKADERREQRQLDEFNARRPRIKL